MYWVCGLCYYVGLNQRSYASNKKFQTSLLCLLPMNPGSLNNFKVSGTQAFFFCCLSLSLCEDSSTAGSPDHLSAILQDVYSYLPLFWELQTELQRYSWPRLLHKALVRSMSLHRDDYSALHSMTE